MIGFWKKRRGALPRKGSVRRQSENQSLDQEAKCTGATFRWDRNVALSFCFDAFSSREPVSTPHQVRGRLSLENALVAPIMGLPPNDGALFSFRFSEPTGSIGRAPVRRGLRPHKRNSRSTCLQLLPRPGQLTLRARLHRSNRSVWSGFRPDRSECAWQRSWCVKSFNPPLPGWFPAMALKKHLEMKATGRGASPYFAGFGIIRPSRISWVTALSRPSSPDSQPTAFE